MPHPKSIIRCARCKRDLPRESFDARFSGGRQYGVHSRCRECQAEIADMPPRVEKLCERCGVPFTCFRSRSHYSRYCSPKCGYKKRDLIENPEDPSSLLVPLSKGQFAVIDKEDAPIIAPHNWTFRHGPYAQRTFERDAKRTSILMHREIMNAPAGVEVDHRDGNGLNNRRSNLRLAERWQNAVNRKHGSGYRGVCRWGRYWIADIGHQGKRMRIGYFSTPEEAARAYDAKAVMLHGDFARLNFPQEAETASRRPDNTG